MDDLDITRLRVYVVAPDVTPPYRFTGACEFDSSVGYEVAAPSLHLIAFGVASKIVVVV